MQFFLLFLSLSFVLFLFCLHIFGKDDFILLRKNISLETLFNLAFIAAGIGLFSARVVYVAEHPSSTYLNPLVFFIFPYFPGLSLVGGICGSLVYLYLYCKQQKYPVGRVLDIFSMAFLSIIPIGVIGQLFISQKNDIVSLLGEICMYVAVSIFFLKLLHPRLVNGEIRDGKITHYFLATYSLVALSIAILKHLKAPFELIRVETVLLILLAVGALFVIFYEKYKRKK